MSMRHHRTAAERDVIETRWTVTETYSEEPKLYKVEIVGKRRDGRVLVRSHKGTHFRSLLIPDRLYATPREAWVAYRVEMRAKIEEEHKVIHLCEKNVALADVTLQGLPRCTCPGCENPPTEEVSAAPEVQERLRQWGLGGVTVPTLPMCAADAERFKTDPSVLLEWGRAAAEKLDKREAELAEKG